MIVLLGPDEIDILQARLAINAQVVAVLPEKAGPFSDQPDDTLRGLCFYATSVEQARELAASDPSVRAGRMAVEVMTWWTKKGSVTFQRQ